MIVDCKIYRDLNSTTDKLAIQSTSSFFEGHRVGVCFDVSMSASHTTGRGFAPRPGHTKDYNKSGTNCIPPLHTCVRVGV